MPRVNYPFVATALTTLVFACKCLLEVARDPKGGVHAHWSNSSTLGLVLMWAALHCVFDCTTGSPSRDGHAVAHLVALAGFVVSSLLYWCVEKRRPHGVVWLVTVAFAMAAGVNGVSSVFSMAATTSVDTAWRLSMTSTLLLVGFKFVTLKRRVRVKVDAPVSQVNVSNTSESVLRCRCQCGVWRLRCTLGTCWWGAGLAKSKLNWVALPDCHSLLRRCCRGCCWVCHTVVSIRFTNVTCVCRAQRRTGLG